MSYMKIGVLVALGVISAGALNAPTDPGEPNKAKPAQSSD